MEDSKKNAYTILELEPSPDVDETTIKKAYRRLAILKHPDKNRDNPNAAEEFSELEQAYRLLLDKDARGALDDLLRAQAQRVARESQFSDKRRKLKEELERRERQSASERSEEEVARQRLKVELERLRRKAEEEERRQRQQAAELSVAIAAQRAAAAAGGSGGASTSYGNGDGDASAAMQAQLRRTLKVTWDPTCRGYSTEELRSIFSAFGAPVQDVVLRDRKKKRKTTALVVMATEAAAAAAAGSVCGDTNEPLLVVPLVGDLQLQPDGDDEAAAACGAGGAAPGQQPDDGLLPRDGGNGPTVAETVGAGASAAEGPRPQPLLQRPARLPPVESSARPLFPSVGQGTGAGAGRGAGSKAAFPVPGGGGLFPSAAASGTGPAATGRSASGFPWGTGPGGGASAPGYGSWRMGAGGGAPGLGVRGNGGAGSTRGGGVGIGSGSSSSFEDEVLEKMRRAAAARQGPVAAAKEATG